MSYLTRKLLVQDHHSDQKKTKETGEKITWNLTKVAKILIGATKDIMLFKSLLGSENWNITLKRAMISKNQDWIELYPDVEEDIPVD